MPDLLDRIQSEIRERLAASRDAVEEYQRLQAALAALSETDDGDGRRAPRRARATSAPASRPRAARGANRDAVLRALADRPGASAGELAAASGVSKPVLYNLLRTLSQRGELNRQELPGGGTGYALASSEPAAESAPAG
jgi:hypothetical protein